MCFTETRNTNKHSAKGQASLETFKELGMYLTSQFANSVQNQIDNLLADGVMTASVIIGSIFLSSDHLFWMEQLAISTGADLVCKQK